MQYFKVVNRVTVIVKLTFMRNQTDSTHASNELACVRDFRLKFRILDTDQVEQLTIFSVNKCSNCKLYKYMADGFPPPLNDDLINSRMLGAENDYLRDINAECYQKHQCHTEQ